MAVCLFYDALWSLSVALLSYTCLLPFSRLITGSTLCSGGLAWLFLCLMRHMCLVLDYQQSGRKEAENFPQWA